MKKILIIIFLLLIGTTAQAQSKKQGKSLEQIAKEKANAITNQVEQRMQNMTFEEFEVFANRSPYAGKFTRAELKKDYNKHHQNDGKAVKIYPEDYEQPEMMKRMKAIDAMETAQTYEEFRNYLKIANPDLKEEDIRKLWNAELKKREKKKQRQKNNQRKKTTTKKFSSRKKEKKKDTTRLAIDKRKRNNNNDGGFDLGNLFGGSDKKTDGKKTSDNGGFDLGKLMDVMESDEAAELGKKTEGMDKDNVERQMEGIAKSFGITEDAEESSLNFRKKLGKRMAREAQIPDEEGFANAIIAYDDANKDETASVKEREKKGREYFKYTSGGNEKLIDLGVAITVNTDPQKSKKYKQGKDENRKKDYEDEIDKGSYKRKGDAIKKGESVEDYLKRMEAEKDEWLRYEDDHSMTLTEMARYGFPRGKLIIIMGQRSWDGYYENFTVNQVYEEFFPIFPNWRNKDFIEFHKQLNKSGGDVGMALDDMEFTYD